MKQLYELLTFPLSVIEDPFWDFVLLTIIGSISFIIAWNFVGETGIRGKAGSILHWTIRIIVMFALCMIISLIIKLIIFIYSIPLGIWIVIGVIIVLIGLIFVVLKVTIFSQNEKKKHSIDKQKNRYIVLMKRIINNYYAERNDILKQEDIIDKNNLDDKYIYAEIEDMLMKEKLISKDKDNNDIIEFRTIIFLEKYVKDSMSYIINVLVFMITFVTLIISTFEPFDKGYNAIFSLALFIFIIVLIFKSLPKDKQK